ncbi:MAG: pseudouridine synthase [Lentisphaeria bacterium]|nr:pseudouridine synthase [Lentisphaeria bacterium]
MNAEEILFQDEELIAIHKRAGVLVHANKNSNDEDEIAMKEVRDYLGKYIYCIHRLDRPTSGILLFALNKKVQKEMSIQFLQEKVSKRYYARVASEIIDSFSIDLPIYREGQKAATPALTHFTPIEHQSINQQKFTLLDIEPKTGRHHQIRRHLKYAGFPIVGDYLYGDIETNNHYLHLLNKNRMLLQAYHIEFTHPKTNQTITIKQACEI